jgi:hypothetical protein
MFESLDDRHLALDDMLIHGLIMQAVDKTIEQGQAPEKYYRNLDLYPIIRLQEASNQTMKNKLELISKGFLVYKIKRHIDHLHSQQKNTSDAGFKDEELYLSSLHSQSANSYSKPLAQTSCDNNPLQNEQYDQDYLDRYDLVIGMAGEPIKRYLAEIEKKIGKPMSSSSLSRNTNDNGGFGIMGTTGRDRDATLMLYSSTTGYVQVNMNSCEFPLTESGKRYFRQMDPEIG